MNNKLNKLTEEITLEKLKAREITYKKVKNNLGVVLKFHKEINRVNTVKLLRAMIKENVRITIYHLGFTYQLHDLKDVNQFQEEYFNTSNTYKIYTIFLYVE